MKFDKYQILPELKKSLEEEGFRRPTDIQFRAIPSILNGEDVLAIAQTGTGKTAAFVIPILDILSRDKNKNEKEESLRCLVMVPTRELAVQITDVFHKIGKYTKLRAVCLMGGVDQDRQVNEIEKGVDILISTPGRMFDLIYQKVIKITRVKILVLDEADLMLDLGFNKDIHDVLKFLPKEHQTLFFSATINPRIKDLAYELVTNAIRIQIAPKDPVSKNIDHAVAFIEMDDKRFFLERFVKDKPESKILVFVRTKVRAERVQQAMERVGIKSLNMHGGKEQEDRLRTMEIFKKGEIKLLISTDVNARGVDIPNVDYVINYDLPEIAENYVHRVGRTGRGIHKGHAVSFCSTGEKEILDVIESFLGTPIREIEITKSEYKETLDLTEESGSDWRKLLEEANNSEKKQPKGRKK
jgi:ATP-dependent RNA helicase RhlE